MKSLYFILLILLFSVSLSCEQTPAQATIVMQKSQTADWAALFPEISGCKRTIQPLTQNGEVFEQTAIYEREDFENYKCGSITLRFAPRARQAAAENFKMNNFSLFRRKTKINDFEAYTVSPQCGNDDWRGSTTVYFDENKVLIVSAYRWSGGISGFPQTADYALMKKLMDALVKNKSQ